MLFEVELMQQGAVYQHRAGLLRLHAMKQDTRDVAGGPSCCSSSHSNADQSRHVAALCENQLGIDPISGCTVLMMWQSCCCQVALFQMYMNASNCAWGPHDVQALMKALWPASLHFHDQTRTVDASSFIGQKTPTGMLPRPRSFPRNAWAQSVTSPFQSGQA